MKVLLSHWVTGPTAVLAFFGAVKWFDAGSTRLDLWDMVCAIVILIAWLRWTAEREFEDLRGRVGRMSDEIERLSAKQQPSS